MPNLPISQLPEINVTDPNALLVIVTSGTTYNIPFSSLTASIFSGVDESYVPVFTSDTKYVSSQIFQTPSANVRIRNVNPIDYGVGEELLGVHVGDTDNSIVISSTGSLDSGLGITHQNTNSGHSASSDVVVMGDIGDYDQGYIDMGVNSSTYSGFTGVFALGGPNDAYVFSTSRDLYIGNATKDRKLIFFNGGFETDQYSVLYVHEDRTITINSAYVDPDNPSALRIVNANSGSTSMIYTQSDINDFAEINSVNINSGDTSSSDIVATNDLGVVDNTQGYIDMGINSTTFNQPSGIGKENDAYLYSTGRNLFVGNASAGNKLVFFNGGADTEAYAKFYIHEDSSITINTSEVDPNNPAAIRIINVNDSTSMIHADGSINDFSEIANVNISSGEYASSDLTCTNDIGNADPTQGYIDMGINSSSYNNPGELGGPGDTYLYGKGNELWIGNATENTISNTYIFTNGINDSAIRISVRFDGTIGFHKKVPDYPVDISGTTRVDNGDFIVSNGQTNLGVIQEALDNADAISKGLIVGDVYRTGDILKIVH